MRILAQLLAAGALLLPFAADAQERDYCPERPGIDTPACTMAKGRISVETSIADWTRDDQPDGREDSVLIGDTLVRIGMSDTLEARIGFTPFGHDRMRDEAGVDTTDRVGDVSLGMKANLRDPDGSGLAIALLPFVTLPVGRRPIGDGDWGGGMLVPVTYEINDTVSVDLTPELDAAVDDDGRGRHVAFSTAAGLAFKLNKTLTAMGEVQAIRDDDPGGKTTQAIGAASLAWSATDDLQFDVFGAVGLTHDTPDARLYAGIARRF